jgi:hypothetical protein
MSTLYQYESVFSPHPAAGSEPQSRRLGGADSPEFEAGCHQTSVPVSQGATTLANEGAGAGWTQRADF